MTEETQDVKEGDANAAPVQEQEEQTPEGSEPVKTPEVVDKNVYEKVREAMKSEREAKRVAEARNAELEERIAKLEQDETYEEGEKPQDYRAELVYLMQKDSFVKENLDLIEDRIKSKQYPTIDAVVRDVKADFFDRIQKEVSAAEENKPLKQEKPTATQEQVRPELTGDVLKDALDGKIENIPTDQLAAIKRVLGK